MAKITRTVKMNKENNDRFVIIQTVVEEVNAEELKNMYNKIKADEMVLERNIINIPKHAEKQLNEAKSNLEMVKTDIEALGKYAEPMIKKENEVKDGNPD